MGSLVTVSQKCQYALRAMFQLALHYPSDSVIVLSEIANAQDIPVRFLELIIAKLRKEGFVRSQRGQSGGYVIAKPPVQITVGEIFRAVEGADAAINFRSTDMSESGMALSDDHIFKSLYMEARTAISKVFDTKTLQDLIDKKPKNLESFDYGI